METNISWIVWKWKIYGALFHVLLLFFFICAALVVSLLVVLSLPIVIAYSAAIILKCKKWPSLGVTQCDLLENCLLKSIDIKNSTVESDWMSIDVDGNIISLHSIMGVLKGTNFINNKKPNILWVHGVGGTAVLSMVKSGVLDKLTDTFNVFAVDLPGFGRSTLPLSCIHMTEEEYEDLLMKVLKKYCEAKGLTKVFVMGHSFGAYHALIFSHRYPELVNRLLVVGPGGIFQVPSKTGPFMSSIFSLGLPMYPLRLLGNAGLLVFHSLLWAFSLDSPLLHYWYQVQASPTLMSDTLVLRFFLINYFTSTWNRPAWKKLLELKIPVALVFGEVDNISPPMQGLVASTLAGSQIPLYFIGGGWHVPMAVRNGLDFSTIIKHSMSYSGTPTECCRKIVKSLPEDVSNLLADRFYGGIYSAYSIADCDLLAKQYYTEILKLRLATLSAVGEKLTKPPLWLVNGEIVKEVGSVDLCVIDEHKVLIQHMFVD